MKTFYPTVLKTVILFFFFTISFNSLIAQCNYASGGNGVSVYAKNPITMDGSMNDWTTYLNDPDNNTYDNLVKDLDGPISDKGRDLSRVVTTQDASNLYVYISREGSTNNTIDLLIYLDINQNDAMDLNEPVVHFNWSGSNRLIQGRILNYIPAATATMNRISLNMDGAALGGTLTVRTNFTSVGTGSLDGLSMEAQVPFSLLSQITNGATINSLKSGQNFKFHISSINGNISSIPGKNSINDNFGGCVIAPIQNGILPVNVLNFAASLKNEIVYLNWTATEYKNFSHFILQKSTDGKNFSDVVMFMADAFQATAINQYQYKDDVKKEQSSNIYYRLQLVDVDGSYEFSSIKTIQLNKGQAFQVQTYPNPAVNQLNVQVPASWEKQTIRYEIYSTNGMLVQQLQNNNGTQQQNINVSMLQTGNYILKVSNGKNSYTTKFIKY